MKGSHCAYCFLGSVEGVWVFSVREREKINKTQRRLSTQRKRLTSRDGSMKTQEHRQGNACATKLQEKLETGDRVCQRMRITELAVARDGEGRFGYGGQRRSEIVPDNPIYFRLLLEATGTGEIFWKAVAAGVF